jgi:hypothetical protein
MEKTMSIWHSFFSWLETINLPDAEYSITSQPYEPGCIVNPASGLPMATSGDCTGVDVAGNPFGTNLHDDWSSHQPFDDTWPS